MGLPLNIDWQQILLHLFNFVILFAILYFLLYRPVKEFMDKRTENYKKLDDETKLNLEKSEKAKGEYLKMLASAHEEISAQKENVRREMEEASLVRRKQAEDEAEKILDEARRTLEKERTKMIKQVQAEISGMVVAATEKLVLQSGTKESYEQFLAAVERGGENE